jgi:hypothetical protein
MLTNNDEFLTELFIILKNAKLNVNISLYGIEVLKENFICENNHSFKVIFYITYIVREKTYHLFSSSKKEYDKPFLKTNDRQIILEAVNSFIAEQL